MNPLLSIPTPGSLPNYSLEKSYELSSPPTTTQTKILSYHTMGFDAYACLSTRNITFLTKLRGALTLSYFSVLPSLTLC
ncbi:hypothetical protein E1A91_D11G250000v1 [Gossypium mustelinum]|uniref:Uncharacterized protein n=1 Tax=Gossypium mustelinum TaxID=34275 RepID=A0A5D2SVZ3_GOSMU|nr:hypothetical protein E1A91_D11G250000v1 [Gossypium mustelinum]